MLGQRAHTTLDSFVVSLEKSITSKSSAGQIHHIEIKRWTNPSHRNQALGKRNFGFNVSRYLTNSKAFSAPTQHAIPFVDKRVSHSAGIQMLEKIFVVV